MTTETRSIASLAHELSQAFTAGQRNMEGRSRSIRILKDGSSEWLTEVVHHAYGDMLPDDWRYAFVEQVAEAIAEANGDEDAAREDLEQHEDIYTADLTAWLGSRADRISYCDEAAADYGDVRDITTMIQLGMRAERLEVFRLVWAKLAEMAGAE